MRIRSNIIIRHIHFILYLSILFFSILYGLVTGENFLFTIVIGLGIFYLIFLYQLGYNTSLLTIALVVIFSVRYYPYLLSIPLGVDPIRDIIYQYMTYEYGHTPLNPYRFVDYYKYFPSTQILPLMNSIVSGISITYGHYLVLSTLISLGSICIYIIVGKLSGSNMFKYFSILLYGLIPSLATWGYWVIPMSFSILYSIYSILLLELYNSKRNPIFLILSFIFTAFSLMTHAVVGALLIGYYILLNIILLRRGIIKREYQFYSTASVGYALAYWWLINFFNYLNRFLEGVYHNLQDLSKNIVNYISHPYTRSEITPSKPVITYPTTPHPTPPIQLHPATFPWYYILPRWIWSSLLILIPLILLLIYRHRSNSSLYSISLYGLFLGIFTVSSLFLHIIWKADRYILSPASIYLVISIAGYLGYIQREKGYSTLYRALTILTIALLVSSLLEPRVSFYTNPIEGDRVTFTDSEMNASRYMLKYYSKGRILADYNLMTSYISYLIHTRYLPIQTKIEDPLIPYDILRRPRKNIWVFLLRRYAVESSFIWKLNFRSPSTIINAYYNGHMIYSSNDNYIFARIGI